MNRFQGIVFSLAKYSDWIARVALILLASVVVANIIGRLFSYPLEGTRDYAGLLGAVVISFSIAYCQVKKGHVSLSFLIERLPSRAQAVVDSVTSIISVILFMVLTWRCGIAGTKAWEVQQEVGQTGLPLYPFIYMIAFGSLVLALVLVIDAYKALSRVVKK